jgi:PD-(D/E)XK nuclease superfamily
VSDGRRWVYGRAVSAPATADARLRYVSVSRIATADPEESGCLRKWAYEMVHGKKRPETRATKRGVSVHGEIERYLKTGDRSLSSLTLSGMHMVPDPGPGLFIEQDMAVPPGATEPETDDAGARALALAPMDVGGVSVLGRIDLIHGRGTNKGATSVEDAYDPPGTIEICDWKTTSSTDWIKKPRDLPALIQTATYAEWGFRVEPRATSVRLSLGYFVERGGPSRKVSLRVMREDVQPRLARAAAVVAQMRDAAREPNVDLVDANTSACRAYGGCPHREYCTARMHESLASFVGQTAAERIIAGNAGAGVGVVGAQQEDSMGLLDSMKAEAAAKNGVSTTLQLAPQPPAQPTPAPDRAAEIARLQAEEAEQRDAVQFRAMLEKLEAYAAANAVCPYVGGGPLGIPAFGGAAAKLYAKVKKVDSAHGFAGGGAMAKAMVDSLETAASILQDLDAYARAGHIKPAFEAPAPPAAMLPVAPGGPALFSPETPPSSPVATPAAPSPPPATTSVAGTQISSPPAAAAAETAQPPAGAEKSPAKKRAKRVAPGADALVVYVNCALDGLEAEPLQPYVDAWLAELARAVGGGVDVRFQPNDSPLSFGKWKGALASAVREAPIPPGAYHLDARGSETAEVVVEALRAKVRATGGALVRGY